MVGVVLLNTDAAGEPAADDPLRPGPGRVPGRRSLSDDGLDVVVAVMHSSDRYLAVAGRVLSTAA